MRDYVLFTALLAALLLPQAAIGGIWNLNAGLATERQTDRDSEEIWDSINLLAAATYTSPDWKFALDLQLKWETQEREFDSDIWSRKGDFLRPVKALLYSPMDGSFSAGLEVLESWTPGAGYLVRELSGSAEVDYVLPGILVKLESGSLKLELGADRPVDPTVQAAALMWEPWRKAELVIESVVDPEAPEVFTGNFDGGRPKADVTSRLTGTAVSFALPIHDGRVLDIKAGGHAAMLGDDASGLGWEVKVTLDMSSYYLNRLSLNVGSVDCRNGYVPSWFDAVYPVQRWGLSGEPPLAANPLDGTGEDRRMEMYDVIYELGSAFRASAGFDRFTDDSLRRARFLLNLKESGGRGLQTEIWSRAEGPDEELFRKDQNFFARVSALYAFMPHMMLKLSYDRSWAFQEEKGGLVPLSSILLGVMYNISL